MNELTIRESQELQAQAVTEDMFMRFVSFIDAAPKTVQTYTRAIRQLFAYLGAHGITAPTREDIISWREELKATGHKPTTVQNYITAARLFFQWTEQERIYPQEGLPHQQAGEGRAGPR